MRSDIENAWWQLFKSLANFYDVGRRNGESPDDILLRVLEALLLTERTAFKSMFGASFRPIARPSEDDSFALTTMGMWLSTGNIQLKPASRAAARHFYPDANEETTAHRLRRKFRKDQHWYLRVARLTIAEFTPEEQASFPWQLNQTRQILTDLMRRLGSEGGYKSAFS
jgi:hypothetical protein